MHSVLLQRCTPLPAVSHSPHTLSCYSSVLHCPVSAKQQRPGDSAEAGDWPLQPAATRRSLHAGVPDTGNQGRDHHVGGAGGRLQRPFQAGHPCPVEGQS